MKAPTSKREPAETKYQIKLAKNTVTFIWGSTPRSPLKSSIDLKAKTNPEELISLANESNIPVKENKILAQNLEVYDRLLIYARARPSLRKNIESIHELEEQTLGTASWDAHYRAPAFRELWWKHGKCASPQNAAKAFKLFFEIK